MCSGPCVANAFSAARNSSSPCETVPVKIATFQLSLPSDFAASVASVTASAAVVFSSAFSAGAAVVAAVFPPPHPARPNAIAAAVTRAIIFLLFIIRPP